VIVYENYDQNGIGTFFRIFDLLGLGEEKQANLNYLDDQISPDVISLTNGNFVISWIDDHFDSTFTHLSIFNRYGVQISNEIKAIYEVGSFNTARLVQHKDDRFLMIYSNADTWNGTKLYGKEIFFDGQISFEDTQLFFTNKSFYGYEINKYNNDYLFFAFESSDLSGFGIYGVSISSYITAVDEKSSKHSFVLAQNFPNPFNPKTFIYYSLSKGSHIHIEVFDILGKKIKDLVNDFKNEGSYSEVFDGSDLSTGCYFYKFSTENLFQVKKMLLIK
jgi:hypothetical protein